MQFDRRYARWKSTERVFSPVLAASTRPSSSIQIISAQKFRSIICHPSLAALAMQQHRDGDDGICVTISAALA